jgi:hypothetical protein
MSFAEAVVELRGKYPKADMSPSAVRGQSVERAVGIDFEKGKGGVYTGRDTDGTEVLVYYNDTEHRICCTEIGPEEE